MSRNVPPGRIAWPWNGVPRPWRRHGHGGPKVEQRYLLLVRFALFNLVALSLIVASYLQGWMDGLIAAHLAVLTLVIVLVFVFGLMVCTVRVWQTSRELNDIKAGRPAPQSRVGRYLDGVRNGDGESRSMQANVLRLKLSNRIAIVGQVANTLVILGLIGTVIGFVIALSGVDPLAASDVERVASMVSNLIQGMAVALNTTLVGAVLYVWLIVDHRILATGTVNLLTAAIELADGHGRP